jgi:hypothetical protein
LHKQMNTCALKQENSNLIWKRDMSDLYPYSLASACVESIQRF